MGTIDGSISYAMGSQETLSGVKGSRNNHEIYCYVRKETTQNKT